MPAVGFRAPQPIDATDALIDAEVPVPVPGARDLLVEVRAVSVNPVDTKVRRRPVADDSFKILGWDASGVVAAVGDEVSRFSVGDEIYYAGAINRPGCDAAYHLVDERIVGHKPRTLTHAEAASLPLTAITAWESLFDRLGARPGDDRVLIIVGAAGGVGSVMVQLARARTDLTVVGTASRPDSRRWLEELGVHHVIDHRRTLADQIEEIAPYGAAYLFSPYSTGRAGDFAAALAPQGHLVAIDDPEEFDITAFKAKSISFHWESMFTRPVFETPDVAEQGRLLDQVAALVEDGKVRHTMTRAVSGITAANLIDAHREIETGRMIGKLVLIRD